MNSVTKMYIIMSIDKSSLTVSASDYYRNFKHFLQRKEKTNMAAIPTAIYFFTVFERL